MDPEKSPLPEGQVVRSDGPPPTYGAIPATPRKYEDSRYVFNTKDSGGVSSDDEHDPKDPMAPDDYGAVSCPEQRRVARNWPAVAGLVLVGLCLLVLLASLVAWTVITQRGEEAVSSAVASASMHHTAATSTRQWHRTHPRLEMEQSRIDCYPESEGGVDLLTQAKCEARGCVYEPSATPRVPWCYVPQSDYGFRVVSGPLDTPLGQRWLLTRKNTLGVYDTNFENVTFDVETRDDNILRFKFETPEDPDRFQIPWQPSVPAGPAANPQYEVLVYQQDPFSFSVVRLATGTVIWDTGVGGLVFSDQFLQIATTLPTSNVYGFGENVHEAFRHDVNFRTWPIWPRDDPPHSGTGKELNVYSSYPFYECIEPDGQAHGVLLWNSNSMDYTFTPEPMLVYKTIGGILDFYVFMGPTPENVIQQYTGAVGRPIIPPYWSLGFQLSRYGYKNTEDMRAALNRTQFYGIPLDLQYADIDYMDRQRSFTLDLENFTALPQYIDELKAQGMRSVFIVNPTVEIADDYGTYLDAVDNDVLTVFESVDVMPPGDYDLYNRTDVMGTVWPEWIVTFVDFFKTATQAFWTAELQSLYDVVQFDGIWLDMNEPGNFDTNGEKAWNWPEDRLPYYTLKCPVNQWDDPPYRTKASIIYDNPDESREERLSFKTLCLQAVHGDQKQHRHYNVHSLYGHTQTLTTWNSLLQVKGSDQRPMIISRSMFAGDGQYGGRWLGDNSAKWLDLQLSVVGMLESNLFGVPYIGADICGFFGNTTVQLCKRWQQLGAFYPYSRNHNHIDAAPQDPGFLGEEVAVPTRDIMIERYRLLPFLYSLFYRAHVDGNTVVRSLAHEFPADSVALAVDRQFLWGASLLVSPILEQDAVSLSYYLPSGRWYDYWTGASVTDSGAITVNVTVNDDSPPAIHIRGGYILPTQGPAVTTTASRLNPFGLKVALDAVDGDASGELFWDDGTTLDTVAKAEYHLVSFTCAQSTLQMTVEQQYPSVVADLTMDTADVYGVSDAQSVTVNGQPHVSFTFDGINQILSLTDLGLAMDAPFTVVWSSVA